MRIISGAAKGRRLGAPRGPETRPMTDRAKEAIFSALGEAVVDAAVLDLYAGSGSLGLEALSRGASSAVFVERRREAVQVLQRNVDAVGLGGAVRVAAVEDYLARSSEDFDLCFVDPPYEMAGSEVDAVLAEVASRLSPGAVVVVHRRVGSEPLDVPTSLALSDRRRYGDAEISRLIREERE